MSNIKAEIDASPPSGSVNLQITVIFNDNKKDIVATILQ